MSAIPSHSARLALIAFLFGGFVFASPGCKGDPDPFSTLELLPPDGPGELVLQSDEEENLTAGGDGAPARYATRLQVGEALDFEAVAIEGNLSSGVTITAEVTGGTLSAEQAGFDTPFPAETFGRGTVTLSVTGTTANPGTIEITVVADDHIWQRSWILKIFVNSPPLLDDPAGPGAVTGGDGVFESTVALGAPLALTVRATDADGDAIDLRVEVTGGTLTAAQAGYSTPLPATATAEGVVLIELAGVAQAEGTIELTAWAEDEWENDTWTLTIRVFSLPWIGPPSGPGPVEGGPVEYTAQVVALDPLDFTIDAFHSNPAEPLTFTATVVGGTLSAAAAGFSTPFPATENGTSPVTLSFAGTGGLEAGTIRLRFEVTSSFAESAVAFLTIEVVAQAPTFTNRPLEGVLPGDTYSYMPTAIGIPDPTIHVSTLPRWLTWDGTRIIGTPSESDLPTTTITVTASNGVQPDATITFTISAYRWHFEAYGSNYVGVWASPGGEIFAPTEDGVLHHFDGQDWIVEPFIGSTLAGVWGTSATNVYLVGHEGGDGFIRRYDGTDWAVMHTFPGHRLSGIWGHSANELYVVAEQSDMVWRFTGTSWIPIVLGLPSNASMTSLWGTSANNLYMVVNGSLIRFNGAFWSGVNGPIGSLNAIGGTGANNVFAIGDNGVINRFDGSVWYVIPTGSTHNFLSVAGITPSEVFFGTENERYWRYTGIAIFQQYSASVHTITHMATSSTDVIGVGLRRTQLGSIGPPTPVVFQVSGIPDVLYGGGGTTANRRAIAGVSAQGLMIVGDDGVLQERFTGTWRALRPRAVDWYSIGALSGGHWVFGGSDRMAGNAQLSGMSGSFGAGTVSGVTGRLNGAWANSSTNVFFACDGGHIYFGLGTGSSMTSFGSPTSNDLHGIWGVSTSNLFVVGAGGTFYRHQSSWSSINTATTVTLRDVWGSSAADVHVVGDGGTMLHYDGATATSMPSGTTNNLHAVHGRSHTDAYATGERFTLRRYDGVEWIPMTVLMQHHAEGHFNYYGVWADPDSDDVYIVGDRGMILRWGP